MGAQEVLAQQVYCVFQVSTIYRFLHAQLQVGVPQKSQMRPSKSQQLVSSMAELGIQFSNDLPRIPSGQRRNPKRDHRGKKLGK